MLETSEDQVRRVFSDATHQQSFDRDGFVLIPGVLKDRELEGIRSLYDAYGRPPHYAEPGGLGVDVHKLSRELVHVLRPGIDIHLSDYRLAQATFFSKPGRKRLLHKGGLQNTPGHEPHMDPTIVDENQYQSLVVWVPLGDVDVKNGCLWVLRGSHNQTLRWRAFPFGYVFRYAKDFSAKTPADSKYPLPMKEGDVLFFHPALIHGSGPNQTKAPRLALQLYAVPREAEVIHCRVRDDGKIALYRADDDYMLSNKTPAFDELGPLIDVVEPDPSVQGVTVDRGSGRPNVPSQM